MDLINLSQTSRQKYVEERTDVHKSDSGSEIERKRTKTCAEDKDKRQQRKYKQDSKQVKKQEEYDGLSGDMTDNSDEVEGEGSSCQTNSEENSEYRSCISSTDEVTIDDISMYIEKEEEKRDNTEESNSSDDVELQKFLKENREIPELLSSISSHEADVEDENLVPRYIGKYPENHFNDDPASQLKRIPAIDIGERIKALLQDIENPLGSTSRLCLLMQHNADKRNEIKMDNIPEKKTTVDLEDQEDSFSGDNTLYSVCVRDTEADKVLEGYENFLASSRQYAEPEHTVDPRLKAAVDSILEEKNKVSLEDQEYVSGVLGTLYSVCIGETAPRDEARLEDHQDSLAGSSAQCAEPQRDADPIFKALMEESEDSLEGSSTQSPGPSSNSDPILKALTENSEDLLKDSSTHYAWAESNSDPILKGLMEDPADLLEISSTQYAGPRRNSDARLNALMEDPEGLLETSSTHYAGSRRNSDAGLNAVIEDPEVPLESSSTQYAGLQRHANTRLNRLMEDPEDPLEGSSAQYAGPQHNADARLNPLSQNHDNARLPGNTMLLYTGSRRSAVIGEKIRRDTTIKGRRKKPEINSDRRHRPYGNSIIPFLPDEKVWRWSGESYSNSKAKRRTTRFYHAIEHEEETIRVGDTVVVRSATWVSYIGTITALWQTGEKMKMTTTWYYRPQEIRCKCPPLKYPGGVFSSKDANDNPVHTVSHKCEVLTWEEYQNRFSSDSERQAAFESNEIFYIAGTYDHSEKSVSVFPVIPLADAADTIAEEETDSE